MTVKKLIDELSKLDPNLIVIYQGEYDSYEPCPMIMKYDFRTNYYTGKSFETIEKHQEFVAL